MSQRVLVHPDSTCETFDFAERVPRCAHPEPPASSLYWTTAVVLVGFLFALAYIYKVSTPKIVKQIHVTLSTATFLLQPRVNNVDGLLQVDTYACCGRRRGQNEL